MINILRVCSLFGTIDVVGLSLAKKVHSTAGKTFSAVHFKNEITHTPTQGTIQTLGLNLSLSPCIHPCQSTLRCFHTYSFANDLAPPKPLLSDSLSPIPTNPCQCVFPTHLPPTYTTMRSPTLTSLLFTPWSLKHLLLHHPLDPPS